LLEKIANRIKITEKALDAAWLRNEAISQNIANVDTPGYKRKTVEFEKYLDGALDGFKLKGNVSNEKHIPIGRIDAEKLEIKAVSDNRGLDYRIDGNNVDIDNEMASLAKNTIRYNMLVETLNAGLRRIKSAISEGRR